jgi:Protein of unknown function (DUF3433)
LQKYTSSPPQLAIFTALRNGHLRLASLSFAAILANVLTVALSGVFVIRDTIIASPISATQTLTPIISRAILDSSNTFEKLGTTVAGENGEPFQILISNLTAGTPLPSWTTNERFYLPIELSVSGNESATYNVTTIGFGSSAECSALSESAGDFSYEFALNADATQAKFKTSQKFSNGSVVECFAPMGFTDDTITLADGYHPNTQIFLSGDSSGAVGVETIMMPVPGLSPAELAAGSSCGEMLVAFWVKGNITLSDEFGIVNSPAITETLGFHTAPTANTTSVSLQKLALACKQRPYAARYNVTVDSTGQVLAATELPGSNFTVDETISVGILNQTQPSLAYPGDFLFWHNDSRARDWMSFFISKIDRSDALLNPLAALPDATKMKKSVSDVLGRLFALTLAINRNALLESPKPVQMTAQRLDLMPRVFLSGFMYKLALTIIWIDIAVLLNIYLRMPKPFLPQMPTSIASNLSFFAASHFAQELAEEAETCSRPEDVVNRLARSDKRFGFGRFVGTDGNVHIGIEREPFVHSLGKETNLRPRPKWKLWQTGKGEK